MKLYTVEIEGIYLQSVWGIFNSKEIAMEGAAIAKSQEKDDYHSIFVREYELNKETEFPKETRYFYGDCCRPRR